MDDQRFGTVFRAVRIKRGLRQADVARRAGVSTSTVSRIERGHIDPLALGATRRVGAVLDIRVDVITRWRAGDLDRLLNARHSALHDDVARMFRYVLPAWVLAPETSFSIYGERGVIDIVAWHPGQRALLIIELKTDISDVNELVGTVGRKRRLAAQVVRERGWIPQTVSSWVIVATGRTNRARVARHAAMLRAAFPADARAMRAWLRHPAASIDALSFWSGGDADGSHAARRRVRSKVESRMERTES
jgi:transcriptional regulator with XRE-family HTH domain